MRLGGIARDPFGALGPPLGALLEHHLQRDQEQHDAAGDAEGIEGVARWSNRAGTIAYAKAAKAAGLDDEFLAKFRGESSRVLKWEVA